MKHLIIGFAISRFYMGISTNGNQAFFTGKLINLLEWGNILNVKAALK